MDNHRLVFVHTVSSLAKLFNDLAKELLPKDIRVLHISDETLLNVMLDQGGLSPFIHQRVAEHVVAAEHAGATAVQLTCSSISPCADSASSMTTIPVFKIDVPMVNEAISRGSRIGIAATAPTTLKPTSALVASQADSLGKEVQVEAHLIKGAYPALLTGDIETHDRLIREGLKDLMLRSDIVLLAQASMARVVETIPDKDRVVPILSSPRSAVEHLRDAMQEGSN